MTNANTTPTATMEPPADNGATEQAKVEARNVAEHTKQGASEVVTEVRTQAADLARTARDEARHRADGELGKLAGFLNGIGEELGGMAESSDRTDGYLPALARDGQQAVSKLSQRLEQGGLDGALHDVSMFARRRPGIFLAGALGVGLALGRVTRNADLHSITEEMKSDDGLQSKGPQSNGWPQQSPQPTMTQSSPQPTVAQPMTPTPASTVTGIRQTP